MRRPVYNPRMEPKRVQADSFWTRRSGWLAFAVVVLVSAVGYLLNHCLVQEGVSRRYMMVLSDILTGIVAGGLVLYMARHEKAHREAVRERVSTIAELNHHIRNALQVIKLCGTQPESSLDGRQLQLIKESADRIEWALREVLPKYPPDEDPNAPQPPVGYAAASTPVPDLRAFSERRRTARLS